MNISLLSQRDPAWKNKLLGFHPKSTIGDFGCLLTCFTMIAGWANVDAMNDYRKFHHGFYDGSMASTFDLLGANNGVSYLKTVGSWQRVPVPEPKVYEYIEHLKSGQPAIVEVNFNRRWRPLIWRVKYDMHFVLALPDQTIYDPWALPGTTEQVSSLIPAYGRTLAEAMTRFVTYEVSS